MRKIQEGKFPKIRVHYRKEDLDRLLEKARESFRKRKADSTSDPNKVDAALNVRHVCR